MAGNSKKILNHMELEFFHEQMAMLLEAGLPLPRGIRRFSKKIKDSKFRDSLSRLARGLEQGETLSEAMVKEERFFPPEYVSLIQVGERGGNLIEALALALEQERFQKKFRDSLRAAVIYPFLVLVTAIVTYSIIVAFSYPVFMDIHQAAGAPLPRVSQALYSIFDFLGRYWMAVALIFLALIFMVRRHDVTMLIHRLWLVLPLLGDALVSRFVASFSEGLSILLRGGIPAAESIGLLAGVTANLSLRAGLEKMAASLHQGEKLEIALSAIGVFPELYLAVVAGGEESGNLPDSLSELARMYTRETQYRSRMFLMIVDWIMIISSGILITLLLIGLFSIYFNFVNIIDPSLIW